MNKLYKKYQILATALLLCCLVLSIISQVIGNDRLGQAEEQIDELIEYHNTLVEDVAYLYTQVDSNWVDVLDNLKQLAGRDLEGWRDNLSNRRTPTKIIE